jgi:hypothetical protein
VYWNLIIQRIQAVLQFFSSNNWGVNTLDFPVYRDGNTFILWREKPYLEENTIRFESSAHKTGHRHIKVTVTSLNVFMVDLWSCEIYQIFEYLHSERNCVYGDTEIYWAECTSWGKLVLVREEN